MNEKTTILRLLEVPREFARSDASVLRLLEESGYFENHESITEMDIEATLGRFPDLVDDWEEYSSSKRTRGGWYLRTIQERLYEVGTLEGGSGSARGRQTLRFHDAIKACAAFVKREAESIRNLNLK